MSFTLKASVTFFPLSPSPAFFLSFLPTLRVQRVVSFPAFLPPSLPQIFRDSVVSGESSLSYSDNTQS